MPRVLVVDDSAADRRIVGRLLAGEPELAVEYAGEGAEALAELDRCPADLVVTDLVMPGMDGLELVGAVRQRHPLVPVVLMTSKGSEEIAVAALQQGAASYVPKRMLAGSLLSTVQSVLANSSQQRSHTRLMGCMTRSECVFNLENDEALFRPLVSYLQEETVRIGLCGEADRTRVGLALEEALTNALYHGNLEVGSQLREEDGQVYCATVEKRRAQPPYCHRRIEIAAKLTRCEASFLVRDQGPGFDLTILPEHPGQVDLEQVSGRGVLLMRTFMDEIVYNQTGNAVTLIKRR